MKWLRLPQINGKDSLVTTTSIIGITSVDWYTQVHLSDGKSVLIDGKYSPMQVLRAIENEQDMGISSEIIDLV